MQIRASILLGALALFAFGGVQAARCAGRVHAHLDRFKDGERLATKMAGNNKSNPNCVGENVSPALSWANPPAGTKSYALLMFDPEGRPPGGVTHWVAYGIPASVTGFAEGEVSKQTDKYVGGKSTDEACRTISAPARRPAPPHHYTFMLIATDLEPTALQPGMTRENMLEGARRPRQGLDRHHRHRSPSCNVIDASRGV